MRKRKTVFYVVSIFFFFSFFLTGGSFEKSEMKTLENVFIISWKGNKMKILLNGQEKMCICDEYKKIEKTEIPADIVMRGKRILQVRDKTIKEMQVGEAMEGDEKIEDEEAVEVFKMVGGEDTQQRYKNIIAVGGKEEEKILNAARKKWKRERLFEHKLNPLPYN